LPTVLRFIFAGFVADGISLEVSHVRSNRRWTSLYIVD
jgi:hypothetical protein